jgi:hypothetical protein
MMTNPATMGQCYSVYHSSTGLSTKSRVNLHYAFKLTQEKAISRLEAPHISCGRYCSISIASRIQATESRSKYLRSTNHGRPIVN